MAGGLWSAFLRSSFSRHLSEYLAKAKHTGVARDKTRRTRVEYVLQVLRDAFISPFSGNYSQLRSHLSI